MDFYRAPLPQNASAQRFKFLLLFDLTVLEFE